MLKLFIIFFLSLILILLIIMNTISELFIKNISYSDYKEKIEKDFINIKKKEVWTEPFTGIDFILIPGGNFKIGDHFKEGDRDEKKTRSIGIETFFLGQTEVTQNEWSKLMETNPSRFKGSNNPVEKISINDIKEFINKLNQLHQHKFLFRLPTEAEWEFACTEGGLRVRFCNGKNTSRKSEIHFRGDKTSPVKNYAPNSFGLYDMSGNVWEWTCSEYSSNYNGNEEKCSSNSFFKFNTVRGGSWDSDERGIRGSNRNVIYGGYGPSDVNSNRGFRLAREE